ncbi:MAG: hypothetical protein AMXMBFR66_25900 [Pseudomonadota bacterium]
MTLTLTWDQAKRRSNRLKHGLDFADAHEVLESSIRWDVPVVRNGEARVQSFAYVFDRLRVLTVVHIPGMNAARIVSFRAANEDEREAYHDWLAEEDDDPQASA